MFIFSVLIVSVIGIGTKFVLPSYYYNKQVAYIEESEEAVEEAYQGGDIDKAIAMMDDMENNLGGELYYYDESNGSQSYVNGKGKNRITNTNSEKFIPNGDVSSYTYLNKIDLEIYVIGIQLESTYLVYEVEIQSLTRATDTMMEFILILLGIVLVLGILISFVLANTISKPIKNLKDLAESMKAKNIEPTMVTSGHDEIAELNKSLNSLYEELQGNIYKLNAELHKERNSELLKKRFLAQATHELKTPIAVIRGYAEILYDGMYKDEDERDRFLKNIYDETESVSRLILDVLDYTKMETGNYQLKLESVIVKQYVQERFVRYTDYIEANNLTCHLEINIPDEFAKDMDIERYDQVYKNLISNAVEHGSSRVVTRVSAIGDKLKLSVFNDGEMIKEEDLPNVFESFYKAKGKQKGTGLGLAIVKEIVLLHGGEYRVVNHSDGVEFIIII